MRFIFGDFGILVLEKNVQFSGEFTIYLQLSRVKLRGPLAIPSDVAREILIETLEKIKLSP
jgi:hypothetical protein